MRQQGGRRSAESGGSNVFSPQLARKSYLREESSMTKNSERAIDAKLTRRAFVGAAAATAAVGLAGCAPAATDEAPAKDEGGSLCKCGDLLLYVPAGVPASQPQGLCGGRQACEGGVFRVERLRRLCSRHRSWLYVQRSQSTDGAAFARRR